MAETIDLSHRTTEDAAAQIIRDGKFITRENTREAFASTHVDGQAEGYGAAVVHVRISKAAAELDDEFPDGEQHYRIPLDQAHVIEAFTVTPDGERTLIAPDLAESPEAISDRDPSAAPPSPQSEPLRTTRSSPDAASPMSGTSHAAALAAASGAGLPTSPDYTRTSSQTPSKARQVLESKNRTLGLERD